MKISMSLVFATGIFWAGVTHAAVETYTIDNAHSSISFSVRHFFSPVPGNFSDFEGTILYDPENPANNSAEVVINVRSVDTNSAKRDGHLLSGDFFNADTHPTMTFKSSRWESTGENKFKVTGDLAILETTKSVVLDVTLMGSGEVGSPAKPKFISGWTAATSLKRTDFGIDYGPTTIIGEDVLIEITVEAIQQ